MSQDITLDFYTTAGCHLCEQAEQLLAELCQQQPVTVISNDIAEDEALVERYGIRIPVVRHRSSGAELGWPFGLAELHGLLTQSRG